MNEADIQKLSYRWLRRAIGVLGMALPIGLAGVCHGSRGVCHPATSISGYYNTDLGYLFVTILVLLAVLLFAYPGYDENDDFAGHLAGAFTMGVVIFPTNADNASMDLRAWLHIGFAAAMFLLLAVFCLFLFRRTEADRKPPDRPRKMFDGARGLLRPPKQKPAPGTQKSKRNGVFLICGCVIVGCVLAMLGYSVATRNTPPAQQSDFIYWSETIALFAFGFAWIVKGDMLLSD